MAKYVAKVHWAWMFACGCVHRRSFYVSYGDSKLPIRAYVLGVDGPNCYSRVCKDSDWTTAVVTVNNANKIATRLVYDTLIVKLVWANRIEGAPMPRHQITLALR